MNEIYLVTERPQIVYGYVCQNLAKYKNRISLWEYSCKEGRTGHTYMFVLWNSP